MLHQHQNRTFHDGDCNPRFGDTFWEHWLRPVERRESWSNIQMLCGNLCHVMTGHCDILSWWDCKWKRVILGICLKRRHVNSKRNSAELLGYSSFPLVNSSDRSPQKCRRSRNASSASRGNGGCCRRTQWHCTFFLMFSLTPNDKKYKNREYKHASDFSQEYILVLGGAGLQSSTALETRSFWRQTAAAPQM